ncbi:MAG: carbohydrate-binding family 25 protein [Bacillota bacterium]
MAEMGFFGANEDTVTCTACGCGELMTEFGEENLAIDMDNYTNKGVFLDAEGDRLKLSYKGILAKSGAKDVFAAVSFGDNRNWEDVRYYPMDKIDNQTFEAVLPVNEVINLNVAFKDGANNWDNNSGKNYSF